jgi:hypothetical protein
MREPKHGISAIPLMCLTRGSPGPSDSTARRRLKSKEAEPPIFDRAAGRRAGVPETGEAVKMIFTRTAR